MNDTKKPQDTITQAVTETIENMSFMTVDSTDTGLTEAEMAEAIKASQLILEPHPGELRLIMPRELACEIAGNLYSIEEQEITDAMLSDVVAELLNTISGNIMKRILPGECVFKLGIPETGDQAFIETAPLTVQCNFQTQGKTFTALAYSESYFQTEEAMKENK